MPPENLIVVGTSITANSKEIEERTIIMYGDVLSYCILRYDFSYVIFPTCLQEDIEVQKVSFISW